MRPDLDGGPAAELHEAFVGWIRRQRHLTHHVTLATNWDLKTNSHSASVKIERMKALLFRWDARVNHSLCGRNWQRRPDERLQGFAFVEHVETNIHWHILASLAPGKDAARFAAAANRHWERLVPSGDALVQPIDGLDGLARYDTKELKHAICFEHVQMLGTLN